VKKLRDLSAFEGKFHLGLSVGYPGTAHHNGVLEVMIRALAHIPLVPYLRRVDHVSWLPFPIKWYRLTPAVLSIWLRVKKDSSGQYQLRREAVDLVRRHTDVKDVVLEGVEPLSPPMVGAYSKQDGSFIGGIAEAYILINRYGIEQFYKNGSDHNTASVGFSPRDLKWYGWSHRALYGFKVGDVVKEGDCCASSGYTDEWLAEHPDENTALPVGFTAKSLIDCRTMAEAFAESVG